MDMLSTPQKTRSFGEVVFHPEFMEYFYMSQNNQQPKKPTTPTQQPTKTTTTPAQAKPATTATPAQAKPATPAGQQSR
jgi:hypothetical protein